MLNILANSLHSLKKSETFEKKKICARVINRREILSRMKVDNFIYDSNCMKKKHFRFLFDIVLCYGID